MSLKLCETQERFVVLVMKNLVIRYLEAKKISQDFNDKKRSHWNYQNIPEFEVDEDESKSAQ